MNNKLNLYHDILFLNLKPNKNREYPKNKYKELLKEIKKEYYKYQPVFEIDFFNPPTEKSKYYSELIKNEAVRYFNHIYEIIHLEQDIDIKKMWVHKTLSKVLNDKLIEIHTEITRNNYEIRNIYPNNTLHSANSILTEESFIYQYLKINLIHLYIEIQEAFQDFLIEDRLDEDDLYIKYFGETTPTPSFLKESEKMEFPVQTLKVKVDSNFKPINNDIRLNLKSKANYNCVYNQQLFGEVESRLYECDIIDIDYNFIKSRKQSNHTLLAIIYKVLMDNNYFRRFIVGTNQSLSDTEIRKYLDERYNTDTSQQFRKLTKQQIDVAKNKLQWLEKIYKIQ